MRSIFYNFLVFFILLVSCKQRLLPDSSEKLFERYRKAVVLIRNSYYYEVELNEGTKVFFTEIGNGELSEPYFKEEDAQQNAMVIYGTGFFISKEGLIASNRHVINPINDENNLRSLLKIKFDSYRFGVQNIIEQLSDKITSIENYVSVNYNQLDYASINLLNNHKDSLIYERNRYSVFNEVVNFDLTTSIVRCKTLYLGVAFDNTFVTRVSDFKECVLINKSDEADVDLALIQLKDKTTPSNVKTWFDFENHNPNIAYGTLEKGEDTNVFRKLKIDTKLYMIGFNHGIDVAKTTEGIKAQLTQGTVSQESDQIKVLYSIPSLSGSSGSPVIDQWGNLVAINFAKVTNSQSFNYGILAKHLKTLQEKQ